MGGMFFWAEDDWYAIETVDLWEISLVAIPANPDALFEARSVTMEDIKAQCKYLKKEANSGGLVGELLKKNTRYSAK